MAEAKSFDHPSSTGDWINFHVHADDFTQAVSEFLGVFFGVAVFFFCFECDGQTIVLILALREAYCIG